MIVASFVCFSSHSLLSHSVSTHHRHFTSLMSSTGSLRHYFQIELIRQQELLSCCADPASTNTVLRGERNKLSQIVENINDISMLKNSSSPCDGFPGLQSRCVTVAH
jgi:hypothetical protein